MLTSSVSFENDSQLISLCPGSYVIFVCFSVNTYQLIWYKNGMPFRVYTLISPVYISQLVYEDGISWGIVTLNGVDHDDVTYTNFTSTLIVPIFDEGVVNAGDVIACGNPDILSTDRVTINYTCIRKLYIAHSIL